MQTREWLYKLSGNRPVLLACQIVILIFCFAYFYYYYNFNIYPDKQVKENYEEASCLIANKFLGKKGHIVHQYRANFLVHYTFQNLVYERWVSGNGLDMGYSSNSAEQEDLLSQYDQGGSYQCWVNPDDPTISVLVLRHDWLSTTPLILPTVIIFIVFYYMFTNIVAILAARRAKIKK